jgi:parvulin-like peptidyl-prolyl isomerase
MYQARVLLLLVIFFCAGLSYAAEIEDKNIAATVNKTVITKADVDAEVQRLIPRSLYHQNVDENKRAGLRQKALNVLIEKELKIQKALRLGLEVEKKEIRDELKKVIATYPSRKDFKERLKQGGLTMDDAEKEIERRKLAELVYRVQVTDKVHVGEAEAKTYYEQNTNKFVQPAQYHIKNILLRVPPLSDNFARKVIEDRAEAIVKEIRKGLSFEEAVQKYSEGSEKEQGGDMGFIHKGRLLPEVEKEVLVLKPGEIAGPFQTFRGYYIFLLEGVREERLSPFEEIKEKLIADLKVKETEARAKAWMDELRSSAEIIIKDPMFMKDHSSQHPLVDTGQ